MPSKKKLWAATARCKDQIEREVTALYDDGDRCLLVSRPWCAPASTPSLMATVRRLYPTLAALTTVADYHVRDGVWYGEIAIDWSALAAILNLNRDTVGSHLNDLMKAGFVHYDAADGRVKSTLIRLFPYNTKTGVRLFQIEPSWLPDFILEVAPVTALFDVEATDKTSTFVQVAPAKTMKVMETAIMNAVVTMVKPRIVPAGLGRSDKQDDIVVFASKFKNVAEFDYIYRRNVGVDFDLRSQKDFTTSQGYRDDASERVDWRAEGFSQGGVEVRFVQDASELAYVPQASDIGVSPSWTVPGDDTTPTPDEVAPSAAGTLADAADQAGVGTAGSDRPSATGMDALPTDSKEPTRSHGSFVTGNPTLPALLGGRMSAAADGAAPAAPPPSRPPLASARFTDRHVERELRQAQVEALYGLRGERVNTTQRKRMTSSEISCIETFERLSGVPFCARDLAFLNKCLAFTSHLLVLRAIRDCSRFPKENPGQFLHRDGMSHVWNTVESNTKLHATPKGGKRKAAKAAKPGAGRSSALAQVLNDERAPLAFRTKPVDALVSESVAPVQAQEKTA